MIVFTVVNKSWQMGIYREQDGLDLFKISSVMFYFSIPIFKHAYFFTSYKLWLSDLSMDFWKHIL